MTTILRLDDHAAVRANLHTLTGPGGPMHDSLLVLLAAADSTMIMSVAVEDVPTDPPRVDRVRILGPLIRRLRDESGADGAALVIARHSGLALEAGDLAWRDAFLGAIQTAHLECHGVYVVTGSGSTLLGAGARDAA